MATEEEKSLTEQLFLRIESLSQEVENLKREKADLEILLENTTEHSDTVAAHLYDKAVEAGKQSDRRLAQFLEALPVGVFVVDASGKPYYTNQTAQQILGQGIMSEATVEELPESYQLYLAGTEQLYPSDRLPIVRALRGEKVAVDNSEIHQIDKMIPIEVWASPIFDDRGNVAYAIAAFQDTTERKRSAEALQQAEARYRSIFENAIEGIFQITWDGHYICVNPALAQIYGYESPEEMMNRIPEIKPQVYVDPKCRENLIYLLTEQGEVKGFEYQIYRQDGSIIWVSENTRAICDANGTLLYYEGTTIDITERKQIEQSLRASEVREREKAQQLARSLHDLQQAQVQLVQSEKMSSLGQLVAGIAHEINNPVNFLSGNLTYVYDYTCDLLKLLKLYQKHYSNPAPEIQSEVQAIDIDFLAEDLPKILSSLKIGIDRINQISVSLRTFSRADTSRKTLFNIHDGIDSTLLILKHRLNSNGNRPGITLIKEYENIPLVECYAGQLNQVFMNLIANAIDALEEAIASGIFSKNQELVPTIRISTEIKQNNPRMKNKNESVGSSFFGLNFSHILIRIADNGLGISEDAKQQLFKPLFTTKQVGKGTGLGLSISHQIVVEKHGGQLGCISEPGQGTEFYIEIPIGCTGANL
ncbi:PAS domain S-box protein [Coleofasciculus sp. FACHB-1120]|uniref:PAS domain-containing sensor histidine kinase n=1 Tax=Coleofasciculus sp. FACHB-1120 TaxID=2692783 RepID=UPI001682676A|nr:PAS domain S-box protein [Coleofasciculus sp. FACHB-1120]MBD2740717.1 PAS domain S-box protein [Coleofasciculus sp. FACHB-1120]